MSTKLAIIYLAFILPVICNGQFNISYNPTTNALSVKYTGCEICLLDSPIDVAACECRNECKQIEPTLDEIADFDDCVDDCETNFSDDAVNLEYCLDACDIKLDARRRACLNACGPNPFPVKNIIAYSYRLSAVWDVFPFDPRNQLDITHWQFFDFNYTETSIIEIADWVLEAPWPGIYIGNNTCYSIGMIIYYDDLTRCEFIVWDCNFVG